MIVVSDTSCISALARIGRLDILRLLFGEIVIPAKVYEELLELRHFGVDISLFQAAWILKQKPTPCPFLDALLALAQVDAGEANAIALALEIEAEWIILDDMYARQVAKASGLNITGLGGILLQAKTAGIIHSVGETLRLCVEKANFRLSPAVIDRLLSLAGEDRDV